MAKRSHRASRQTSGKKNMVWTSIRIGSSLSTTILNFQLINDADWVGAAGQPSATIIGIRGWLSVVGTGVVDSNTFMYIGTVDEDVTSFASPNAASTYVQEDIMWTGGTGKGVAAIEGQPIKQFDINVKTKRKIKAGTNLVLSAECNIDDDVRLIGIIRCLLLKGS